MRYMGKNLLRGYPEMAEFAVMGCKDYLKGIAYFEQLDLEQQHITIQNKYKVLHLKDNKSKLYYWIIALIQFAKLTAQLTASTKKLKEDYRKNISNVQKIDYWARKLEL